MVRTASWKGILNFDLININIEIYSAVKSHTLGLTLLHATCNNPIEYKHWCSSCDKEVAWSDIIKGMKQPDKTYRTITQQELKKLGSNRSESVSILECIDASELDPVYLDKHYYVSPAKGTDKAYFLFARTLESMNKIAIGRFALRERQHLCAIRPYKNILLMTTLNYAREIKEYTPNKKIQAPPVTQRELSLAQELIEGMSSDTIALNKYKDTFMEDLEKKLQEHRKGAKNKEKQENKKIQEFDQPTLVELLNASLKKTQKSVHKSQEIVRQPRRITKKKEK